MYQQEEGQSNKINNYILGHPIGEIRAEAFQRKLLKNMCHSFKPFQEYYHRYPVQYLVEPKPTYVQKQQFEGKKKLQFDKQIQYLRGTTQNYVDEEHLQQFLQEDLNDRGLMENHKNKSVILGNMLIFASGYFLKSIILQMGMEEEQYSSENLIYYQFPEPILEISIFEDKNIIIRCRYWIYLFDCGKKQIFMEHRAKDEITALSLFENNNHSILISTYDQKCYKLYEWNINNNSLALVSQCESFWGAHSLKYLNQKEFILGFANKVIIQDLRSREIQTFRRVTQMGNDRFVSLIGLIHNTNQIALAKSKTIDIFELRKAQYSLLSVRHFCQQSPPTCLESFNWIQPYLIAYSPYYLGSSLILNIGDLTVGQIGQRREVFTKTKCQPKLLFDSSKIYKGLYPKSISTIVSGNVLKLFHIDSSQGICIQYLQKQAIGNSNFTHLIPNNFTNYPEQPYKKWIDQQVVEPFFHKQSPKYCELSSEQDQPEVMSQQSPIFIKKNNYTSLDKFQSRISELAKKKDRMKGNDIQLADTYFSQNKQLQQEEMLLQAIKYGDQNKNQLVPTEKLLSYLEKEWN